MYLCSGQGGNLPSSLRSSCYCGVAESLILSTDSIDMMFGNLFLLHFKFYCVVCLYVWACA